jgi:hypothetical protein
MQLRRAKREQARTAGVPEETDQEMMDDVDTKSNGAGSPSGMKPVYLKGLFSVSTTSSKPVNFIRTDIIRVLQQLGVEYREVKGGFSCKHAPSIVPAVAGPSDTSPAGAPHPSPQPDNQHKRKISLGGFRDRVAGDDPKVPKKKASYTTGNSEEESEEDRPRPPHERAAGETSTHVQSDLGTDMTLRFEIFVVKVPLLSLHGIQFKKVDGGTWQYKNMAQKILNELKL